MNDHIIKKSFTKTMDSDNKTNVPAHDESQAMNELIVLDEQIYRTSRSSSNSSSTTPMITSFDEEDEDEQQELIHIDKHHRKYAADEISPSEYMTTSVLELFVQRIGWLVGLLLLQSFSSFILATFEKLLSEHIIITLFLTMLVGSGGNAGSQSTVIIVRGIATGDIPKSKLVDVVWKEFRVGVLLSVALGFVGFARVLIYRLVHHSDPQTMVGREIIALTLSLMAIVMVSVVVGTLMPLFLHFILRVDSAHASPTMQVTMDIIGVLITCLVCQIFLPSKSTPSKTS